VYERNASRIQLREKQATSVRADTQGEAKLAHKTTDLHSTYHFQPPYAAEVFSFPNAN
jgi:hypothetical protein